MIFFQIEDDFHAEADDERYDTLEAAVTELRRRAGIPLDQWPNTPPCSSSSTCCREYIVHEYDDTATPWNLIRTLKVVSVFPGGVVWAPGFEPS